MFTLIHRLHANALLCPLWLCFLQSSASNLIQIIYARIVRMTRDLLFFTFFILLVVHFSAAEYLFSGNNSNNSSNNTANWVCDLGRTTGLTINTGLTWKINFSAHLLKLYVTGEHYSGGWVNKESGGNGCESHHQVVGYVAVFVAVFFYGSNFIPVKRFETGDGIFFQWIMCIGVWLTGLVINFARQQPPFFSPVVIGAVCWTTGEYFKIP